MFEIFYRLFGYRKLGAIEYVDDRDFEPDVIKLGQIEYPAGFEETNLIDVPPKNQKLTNRCVAYGGTVGVEIMLTRRLNKKIGIDPIQLWNLQKRRRAELAKKDPSQGWNMEKKGDTANNMLNCLVQDGLVFDDYDKNGNPHWKRVKFDGYTRLRGDELEYEQWIKKGHPIITGSSVFAGYVKNGFWKFVGKRIGGHLFAVPYVFYDFKMLNSWGGRWCDHGTAKIERFNLKKCFGKYILYGMKITDENNYKQLKTK